VETGETPEWRKALRIIGFVMLFAVSAFTQVPPAVTAACGPEKVGFNVKLDESQHALPEPEPGKARVYFIQEKATDSFAATTTIGLDGAWVGANKNSSYFAVSVEPGEHHVCADVHTPRGIPGVPVGFLHFTAEAGRVYYFDARVVYGSQSYLFLGAVDSDQAKYLIASYPLSVSTPNK
jgi:hypothetical protein